MADSEDSLLVKNCIFRCMLKLTPNELTGGFCNLGPEVPPLEEFVKAKALLQSMHSGGRAHHDSIETDGKQSSLYEHLEESMEAKALTVQPCTDEVTNAMAERTLLKHPEHVWDQSPVVGGPPLRPFGGNFEDDEEAAALPNLSNHALLIEQAGIGKEFLSPSFILLINNLTVKANDLCLVYFDISTDILTVGIILVMNADSRLWAVASCGLQSYRQDAYRVGREELMRVWLALRLLHKKLPSVTALRFWGKIFAIKANYYIAEAEFEPESEPDDGVPGPWDKWRLPKPPKNKGDQDPTDFQGKDRKRMLANNSPF
ncbi:unnamed protein product [Dibothriocephalus latus]|uniref:Uncharacterized protein n=1 Tax=Dibothriocephalus latus TaxID=60516 RepID=A0A3P7NMM6_DIBLA|nr:unnamed protein product [Dibothriocephalus latus]